MLRTNNLLILLVFSFLIINVKLDLGGPCYSVSSMEGQACGVGVHPVTQIMTDCLCHIPGYWEQYNRCAELIAGEHNEPVNGAEVCSRALEYAVNPAGFTGNKNFFEGSTTILDLVMFAFPTYSPGVTNFLDSSSNDLTTTNSDEINSLLTTDESVPSFSSNYIEIPLETSVEASITIQPSTIEISETTPVESSEFSSIISSLPLPIVSESGILNSTQIVSTPVVIISPTPQPSLETTSSQSSVPDIANTSSTTTDTTAVDETTINNPSSVALPTTIETAVFEGGAMGYPSISIAIGLVLIVYLI